MLQVNKEYIEVYKAWGSYALKSSLDDFVLNGSFDRTFFPITRDPKTHIIALGVNNIYGMSVKKNLPGYRLTFKGLVVPDEKTGVLQDLGLELSEVYMSYLKATPVYKGKSFAVRSKAHKEKQGRVDYVISPESPQLSEVLEALGAPKDLILRQN